MTERIDAEHREFKESIKEPAQKVDEATRAVVDKGKEALGVKNPTAPTASPSNSSAASASAANAPAASASSSESVTERIEHEHERFKESIKTPAHKVDEATRSVIKKGKEVVGAEEPTPKAPPKTAPSGQ